MSVQQHHAVSRSFAYLAWTLGVCGAVATGLALDAAHDVTDAWAGASFVVGLFALMVVILGRDTLRIATLRVWLTLFAAGEGVFFGRVAEIAALPLLAAAIGIAALVFLTMAVWGFVTHRSLLGLAGFLFWSLVALVGVLAVASLLGSAVLIMAATAAGIFLFALYTAYDVQVVAYEAARAVDAEDLERIAIEGSIALFLDLANLVSDVFNALGFLGDWFSW